MDLFLIANPATAGHVLLRENEAQALTLTPPAATWTWTTHAPSVSQLTYNVVNPPGVTVYFNEWPPTIFSNYPAAGPTILPPTATWTWTPHDPSIYVLADTVVVVDNAAAILFNTLDPIIFQVDPSGANTVRPPATTWAFNVLDPQIRQITPAQPSEGTGGASVRSLKQNFSRTIMVFVGVAGQTGSIQLSKNGGPFVTVVRTVVDRGLGWYAITLLAEDTDTLGDLIVHFTTTNFIGTMNGEVKESVWDELIEGAFTARQSMRLANAANAGKTSGFQPGPGVGYLRSLDDTKDRITAVVDQFGNRLGLNYNLDD